MVLFLFHIVVGIVISNSKFPSGVLKSVVGVFVLDYNIFLSYFDDLFNIQFSLPG